MKPSTVMIILAISAVAYSQDNAGLRGTSGQGIKQVEAQPPITNASEFRLRIVKGAMRLQTPVTVGEVQFHRMGDEAAVNVMKVMGTRGPLDEAEVLRVLEIMRKAFERPAAIVSPSDRQPHATSFLLQHLEDTTQNQSVKDNIVETRKYILMAGGVAK